MSTSCSGRFMRLAGVAAGSGPLAPIVTLRAGGGISAADDSGFSGFCSSGDILFEYCAIERE